MVVQLEHAEVSDPQRLVANPVVSVLMLAYNHGPWIAEAIEGVIDQDCGFDYELVIAEDASSDETRAIALRYQKLCPDRIRVVYPPNNIGVNANHRLVSSLARGEFVAWCEGDDYWCDRGKLSAQVALLRADPGAATVHSDWVRARRTKGAWQVSRRSMHRRMPSGRLQGDLFRVFYLPKILRTCTLMQRRSALQAFYESGLAGENYRFVDTAMSAYLTSRWRVAYLPRVSAVYRESPGSALRSGRVSFIGFLRSALEFDGKARSFFEGRNDYPDTYRWECAVGLLLQALRIRDLAAARDAWSDLHAHYDPWQLIRTGMRVLRLRCPIWKLNDRRCVAR